MSDTQIRQHKRLNAGNGTLTEDTDWSRNKDSRLSDMAIGI
jgi:hypothetical protein